MKTYLFLLLSFFVLADAKKEVTFTGESLVVKTWLDEQGFTNRSGKPISVSQILVILSTSFYYGKFQYPEAPDAPWYTGAHKPLISKELFDLVQETRGVNKGVWGSKTFAFRGLLKCGRCTADITAQDKFKTLKNGDRKRFVYYNCTRRKDPNCKEKYVSETKLCELLQAFIVEHYQKIDITEKLRAKVDKHFYVTKTLLGHYKIEQKLDNPFIEYSRYVLASGTENERIIFAGGITTKLKIIGGELEFYG
jgi:predicted metal-binding protein